MEEYIKEILNLVDKNSSKEERDAYLKTLNLEQLLEIINFSIEKDSLSWKNRMMLQMVNHSPFSCWVCDDQFIVKLWEAASTEIYGENYIGKEFWRFVEKKERKKAMDNCLDIISKHGGRVKEFDNYYAIEERDIGILTQSFSLYDDISDTYLQGEIGLNIRLEDVQKKHDKILQEQQQILNQFTEKCKDLSQEFLDKNNAVIRTINERVEASRRSELRQTCSNIYIYFNERIRQILFEAILDEADLQRLRISFYEEFDKFEISISESDGTAQSLSFEEEKERVERLYQVKFDDTITLFNNKIQSLYDTATRERQRNGDSVDAQALDDKRVAVLNAKLNYESDMKQLKEKLESNASIETVLIIGRELEKRTEEANRIYNLRQ